MSRVISLRGKLTTTMCTGKSFVLTFQILERGEKETRVRFGFSCKAGLATLLRELAMLDNTSSGTSRRVSRTFSHFPCSVQDRLRCRSVTRINSHRVLGTHRADITLNCLYSFRTVIKQHCVVFFISLSLSSEGQWRMTSSHRGESRRSEEGDQERDLC